MTRPKAINSGRKNHHQPGRLTRLLTLSQAWGGSGGLNSKQERVSGNLAVLSEGGPQGGRSASSSPSSKETPLGTQPCVLNQSQNIFSLDINLLAISTKSDELPSPAGLPLASFLYCTDVWPGPVPVSVHQHTSCPAPHHGGLLGRPCGP